MTAFVHGKATAHVMEFDNEKRVWTALCPYYKAVIDPRDPRYYRQRTAPWCRWCVSVAQRRVDQLTEDVLNSATAERTPA